MTRTFLIAAAMVFTALLIGLFLQSQGSPSSESGSLVRWVSFDEAVVLANRENKKILIDVYTDWCGWCKKMDSEVYADPSIAGILTASFIAVKLNAESSNLLTFQGQKLTEEEFAAGAGVSGYPTTLFLDNAGTPITIVPGFHPSERFAPILRYIGEDHYKSISFQEFEERNGRTRK
jgi:thioredoxin-related protein